MDETRVFFLSGIIANMGKHSTRATTPMAIGTHVETLLAHADIGGPDKFGEDKARIDNVECLGS